MIKLDYRIHVKRDSAAQHSILVSFCWQTRDLKLVRQLEAA